MIGLNKSMQQYDSFKFKLSMRTPIFPQATPHLVRSDGYKRAMCAVGMKK
jgi:hypothetical protein